MKTLVQILSSMLRRSRSEAVIPAASPVEAIVRVLKEENLSDPAHVSEVRPTVFRSSVLSRRRERR